MKSFKQSTIALLALLIGCSRWSAAQSTASPAQQPSDTAVSSSVPSTSVSSLPTWSWTSDSQRMYGMNLGNWLILEKWMSNDWFAKACGNASAEDQWSFMQSIGDDEEATNILQQHYNDWVTEDDIANISRAGFNHLRVPMGYWSFIDIPDVPYINAGELNQLERVLEIAQPMGLYTVLDLHGLPGSQNGEQASGHIGLNGFYNQPYQNYSDQLVDTVIQYIDNSTYRSFISAVAVCNEPVYYNEQQYETLLDFYERSYQKLSAAGIPMMFHPGYPDVNALALWEGFIAGKDPDLAILEIHPYPGRGATLPGGTSSGQADPDQLIQQVCSAADGYRNYGVPVSVTEWSLVSDISDDLDFYSRFYEAQATAWAQSGGSMFWNYRINSSTLDDVTDNRVYSFVDLVAAGVITMPAEGERTNDYINSLQNPCGNFTESWTNPVPSGTLSVTAAYPSQT